MKATTNAYELFGPVLHRIEAEVSLPTTQNLDGQAIRYLQGQLHELTPPNV